MSPKMKWIVNRFAATAILLAYLALRTQWVSGTSQFLVDVIFVVGLFGVLLPYPKKPKG